MFPIRNFSDFLSNMEQIKETLNPPFYVILLYKEEHSEFRHYVISNFINMHDYSGNVAIIVNDAIPEGWRHKNDSKFYNEMMGKDYRPDLNDHEIDIICKYFEIDPQGLPYVISFSNFKWYSFNTFSFADAQTPVIEDFFLYLLDVCEKFEYQQMNYKRLMINTRRQFPMLATKIGNTQPQHLNLYELLIYLKDVFEIKVSIKRREKNKQTTDVKQQKGMRTSTKVKKACQDKAKELWDKAQQSDSYILSSGEMAEHPEIIKIANSYPRDKPYKHSTLQRWVSEVAPRSARDPGLRKKNK